MSSQRPLVQALKLRYRSFRLLDFFLILIFISDVDDATMVRVDLERKIETLHEELDYTRKVRMEEVEDLKQQIQGQFKN